MSKLLCVYFAPRVACAWQKALPVPWAEDQLITNTISAACMETNHGHDGLMKVARLELTTVWLHGISSRLPKMQQLPPGFLSDYKPDCPLSREQLSSLL